MLLMAAAVFVDDFVDDPHFQILTKVEEKVPVFLEKKRKKRRGV